MLFLYAGLIYLVAIAIVLIIKPAFMFRSDGTWKEFGIGRNPKNYTIMPLWLYSIVVALVSYFVVLLLSGGKSVSEDVIMNVKSKDMIGPDLAPGYYMLNKTASKIAGMPKYVYLGPDSPNS